MSRRLDGVLASHQLAVIEAHLRHCPSCSSYWLIVQEFTSQLEGAPLLLPSDGFTGGVMARLEQACSPQKATSKVWPLALLGSSVFAILVLFFVIWAGLSLWPALTHPVLLGKAASLASLLVSIATAAGKAVFLAASLLDDRDVSLAGGVSGLVSLLLILLWARLLRGWWAVGGREGAV